MKNNPTMHTAAYAPASLSASAGVFIQLRIWRRSTKQTTLSTTAKLKRKVNIVPTKRPMRFLSPAPIYCAMMTCPALEKPMAR